MGLDATQKAKVRSDGQSTRLYLAFPEPAVIFSAEINQTFDTDDLVAEIGYDNATGDYLDVLADMTLLIGSTAGDDDVGVARVRKSATTDTLYIGVSSEIDFEDELFLTVVDVPGIFPRHTGIASGGVVEMDWDVSYSDQHTDFDPVPVLGSGAIARLEAGSASVNFDASNSWVIDSTISSYAWEISPSTGVTVTGGAASTPNFAITVAGTYRVRCTLTAANGKTFTGLRIIDVFSDSRLPVSDFSLENCTGDVKTGGWSYQVRVNDESILDSIKDRAFCILFARDVYDGVEGSVGLLEGRENIIAAGWVGGESITDDPEHDSKLFTVYGMAWWMGQINAYPMSMSMVAGTPSGWEEMAKLSVDRALWHFLHWRTTVTAIADFYPTGDVRYAKHMDAQGESLWQQLLNLSLDRIFARPIVDRYGRLFVDVPHNLRPLADRADSVGVMTLESEDHEKTLDFAIASPRAGQVNLASEKTESTGSTSAIYSLSPGHMPNYQGRVELLDGILAATQSEGNSLSGLILGDRMNELPDAPVELSRNNRAFGLAPRQYATVGLDAYTGKLLPKRIELKFDPLAGKLTPEIIFEGETFEQLSVNGDIPDGNGGFIDIPSVPPVPPVSPELPELPPLPGDGSAPNVVVAYVAHRGFWYTEDFQEASPTWWSWNSGLDEDKISSNAYANIDVSRFSERAFTHTSGDDPEMWTSARPGSKWKLIAGKDFFDQYRVPAFGELTTPAGGTMAVDRCVDDLVIFIINQHYGSAHFATQVFLGGSAGLSKTMDVTGGEWEHKTGGMGVYGAGKWLMGWSTYEKVASRFNLSATTREAWQILSGSSTAAESVLATRGGLSGKVAAMWTYLIPLQITLDNGDAFSTVPLLTFSPYVSLYLPYLSVAIDPTGQLLAGFNADSTDNLRVSSDGGSSWALPTGWVDSDQGRCIENCGDSDRWIAQAIDGIFYTDDFFSTWIEKTGDLKDKTTQDTPVDFRTYMIRVMR